MVMVLKRLYRISLLISAFLMIISFVSCDGKNETETIIESQPAEKQVLTMATSAQFYPYEYYEDSQITGIDIEIARLIADKLGMELEIVDIAFCDVISGVENGTYDMGISAISINKERKESVIFSKSYSSGSLRILINEFSGITSVDDLNGKKIGVQKGTTGEDYALDNYNDGDVCAYETIGEAVSSLSAGDVYGVIIDNSSANNYTNSQEGLTLLETDAKPEKYAICFSKENDDLRKKVNEILNQLNDDGTISKIIDKYTK